MSTDTPERLIPEQVQGAYSNTESTVEMEDEAAALAFYGTVKERLLQVNHWHTYTGTATADFQLRDGSGSKVNRPAKTGDFFQIDVPGPDSEAGSGDDWVQIEEIEEGNEPDIQITAMRVRPCGNPLSGKTDTAHFFDNSATSTFVVKRENCIITAGVYGRNEKPNTDTESLLDKIRNTVYALGAMLGFSKVQWKRLVEGLLKKDS